MASLSTICCWRNSIILMSMIYNTAIYVDVKILRIKHKMNHPRVGCGGCYRHLPQYTLAAASHTVAVRKFNVFVERNICVRYNVVVVFSRFHYADDNFQHKNEKPHARREYGNNKKNGTNWTNYGQKHGLYIYLHLYSYG